MKKFDYVIKDELGIHARPAAKLVQESNKFESKVVMTCNGNECEISKLFALMAMGVRHGDNVTVSVEGTDEELAYETIKKFFEEEL